MFTYKKVIELYLGDIITDIDDKKSPVVELRLNDTHPNAILVSVELASGFKFTTSVETEFKVYKEVL